MRKIYWAIVVMVLVFTGYRFFGLQIQKYQAKDEPWLFSIVPTQVGDFRVLSGSDSPGPSVSYRMDDKTYATLKPVGIAGQQFRGPKGTMDAVVIAGDRMESFHDQRWCFKGQGWEITDEHKTTLDIPGYGKVPMWVMKLHKENETPRLAAFTFKTPRNFRTEYQMGQIDYLLSELQQGHPNVGFSFRFIEMDTEMSDEAFFDFVKGYFAAAKEKSNGVL
ncbi:MAG: hypothetical protein JSS65_08990 [Armatimonadetes bacterium]|nr:hypothetical protein [Armatimonadota bacterium]